MSNIPARCLCYKNIAKPQSPNGYGPPIAIILIKISYKSQSKYFFFSYAQQKKNYNRVGVDWIVSYGIGQL